MFVLQKDVLINLSMRLRANRETLHVQSTSLMSCKTSWFVFDQTTSKRCLSAVLILLFGSWVSGLVKTVAKVVICKPKRILLEMNAAQGGRRFFHHSEFDFGRSACIPLFSNNVLTLININYKEHGSKYVYFLSIYAFLKKIYAFKTMFFFYWCWLMS